MMKKTAVSVRRNMAKKPTHDDLKTNESLSVSLRDQNMCLDQVQESAFCPLKYEAIDGNLRSLQSSKTKQIEEEKHEESEDDDDDIFSDAFDTLSIKHSISVAVEAMTPPMPSEDPQPRDFMLNRFTPAAKSMTMEKQLQYALKRRPLPVMSEPIRQIRDIVPAECRATPKRYESITTSPSYFHGIYDEESEDEDEDDAASEYLSKIGCGMMSPQLCFKNSIGVLSSVHGLKEKPYSLRTSSHDQVKSSKVAQLKSRFQSVKKLALDSIYKQKSGSRAQSPVHQSLGQKFNFDSEQLESNLSRPSSPYRHSACMSPYRTVGNISPLHSSGFPGTRKEAEIMRANRLNKHIRNNIKSQELLYPKSTRLDCSTSSVMEKTLYVDTETVETIPEESEMARNKPKAMFKKTKADELQKNNSGCDLSPLSPPPPKKPSDSWLFRNLPSVSSKIPSRRKNIEENSTSVTKWENIVKTSCMHRDHIRYSEELVAKSSCQSKT